MRPAVRRGWEGEGKPKSMPWRGPAGAPATATRGRLFRFGKREGKALGVPAQRKQRRSGAQEQRSGSPTTAPSHGATPTGDVTASRAPTRLLRKAQRRLSKRARVRRSPGKERGESASGSAQKRRALRSAKRGKERVRQPSRSSSRAPDRHPNGPGLQARCAPADRAGCLNGSRKIPRHPFRRVATCFSLQS